MASSMILVLISALLYSAAFVWPRYMCWAVVIFFAPLYYWWHVAQPTLYKSIRGGFIWAFVTVFICFYDLILFFIHHGNGVIKYAVICILLLYCALLGSMWFSFVWAVQRFCANTFVSAILIVFSSVGYFYYVTYCFLWPLCIKGGIATFFPLVPCAEYPVLLNGIDYVSPPLLLGIILLCNVAIINSVFQESLLYGLLGCFLMCSLITISFLNKKDSEPSEWLNKIAYLNPVSYKNPIICAQALAQQINEVMEHNQEIELIIGPEATFPFAYNVCTKSELLLQQNIVNKDAYVLFGAHRKDEKGNIFNSCYLLQTCRIIQNYDKKTLMPLTEFLPNYLQGNLTKNLFKQSLFACYASLQEDSDIIKLPWATFKLFICAEFFFTTHLTTDCPETFIAVVNDSWFMHAYARKLLYLTAAFKAKQWRKNIIYISHHHFLYISEQGRIQSLNSK